MALAGALRHLVHVVAGFTNASRWPDSDYRSTQMSYDLRLRLHGLIERLAKTNTYVLTPEGLRGGCPDLCGFWVTVPQLFRLRPDRTWRVC